MTTKQNTGAAESAKIAPWDRIDPMLLRLADQGLIAGYKTPYQIATEMAASSDPAVARRGRRDLLVISGGAS